MKLMLRQTRETSPLNAELTFILLGSECVNELICVHLGHNTRLIALQGEIAHFKHKQQKEQQCHYALEGKTPEATRAT